MPHPIRVALVVVSSVLSGLIVAFVVSAIEIATDVAVYGFSVAFVVPVGAIGCGFVAGAGYYEASRTFHVRPSTKMLAVPLATAIVSFFAAHWFTFTRYEWVDGQTFADVMSFAEYLRAVTTESGLSFGSNATVSRLGSMGYVVAAIEVLGFAAGGWFAANALRLKPWCATSNRFMARTDRRKQMFESQPPFHDVTAEIARLMEAGDAVAVAELLPAEKPTMKQNRSGRFSLTVDRHDCEDCGGTHAVVTTHERTKNNWQETSRSPIHPEPSEGLVRIVS